MALKACSFDGIYAYGAFHHVPRALTYRTLSGFRDVLTPGGVFVACLLMSERHTQYTVSTWGRLPDNPLQFDYYTPQEMVSYLVEGGFVSVEVHRQTCRAYEESPELRARQASVYQIRARRAQ